MKEKCPGAAPQDCGNYLLHDLPMAKWESAKYLHEVLEQMTEANMRYPENNLSAGVAYQGSYKTCVLGFPFESLRTTEEREYLMNAIMTFFDSNTKK